MTMKDDLASIPGMMGASGKPDRAVVNGAGQAVSALRASVPSAWRPIKSAPRNGAWLLLHVPDGLETGTVTVGAYWEPVEYRDDRGRFMPGTWEGWLGMDADARSSWCDPTHWMPLPEPPAQAIEARRAETLGSACESAVAESDAPNPSRQGEDHHGRD